MSRKKRRSKAATSGNRGWITLVLLVILAFFGFSIYLGHLRTRPEPTQVRSAAWEVSPPVIPDAGSPTLLVWNGCGVAGLGDRVARWLRRQGFDVYETCNADRMDYERTLVVARSKRRDGARAVAERMNSAFGVGQLIEQRIESPPTDVLLILGADFPDSLARY